MSNEDTPSKKSLIDELHSIKELLEKEENNSGKQPGQSLSEIPVLSSPIPKLKDNQPEIPTVQASKPVKVQTSTKTDNYLSEEAYNQQTRVAASSDEPEEDYSVEFMIQEIIDEMIPEIEARLRSRLVELEPEILSNLMNQSQK